MPTTATTASDTFTSALNAAKEAIGNVLVSRPRRREVVRHIDDMKHTYGFPKHHLMALYVFDTMKCTGPTLSDYVESFITQPN